MEKVLQFPKVDIKEYRQKCSFINRSIKVEREDNKDMDFYPCILLVDVENNIPIAYTGYEKFIQSLAASNVNSGFYMTKKAVEICSFLNYMLHETTFNSINEFTLNDIKNYMRFTKKKKCNNEEYATDTWIRRVEFVLEFLHNYYMAYHDRVNFAYNGDDLRTYILITDKDYNKKVKIVRNPCLSVKAPVVTHRKNRVLIYGYFDLLLYEAKKYDPMIALGIALQAYAGLREGEVMNMTCDRLHILRSNFGMIMGIELDLNTKAPFWVGYKGKSPVASFKLYQYRTQNVYEDFLDDVKNMYENHIMMLDAKGYDTCKNAPLFLNNFGKPMTVQTYTGRVKKLFYEHFLPSLKRNCIEQNVWAENAAYIETYEKEYPGAHMFRHWFTMYLLTQTKLEYGEIMKYRNDHNVESMISYIHENSSLLDAYKNSAYRFQEQLLESIGTRYEK